MKFLVLGCNGMAGHMVSLYLKERKHEVKGFARTKSDLVDTYIGDARDLDYIKEIIQNGQFDSVVNCIGILNQFAENNHESAVFLNSYLPHYLAKITENMDTQIIHISTDCVFSGKEGGYTEDSLRDGETFYDRSKGMGELEDDKNVTLRNSIIGPDIKPNGIGLMNWLLQQKDSVRGYSKAIWSGQTTLQLAKTIEAAAKERVSGLYNMVPDSSISKCDLLQLMNKYIRKTPIEIVKEDTFVCNKSLIRARYEGFDYKIPDYETMLKELGDWMREHKDLYPHYELV